MRILFVAMPDSIHTVRWVNQLADTGWDVHICACYSAKPHPELRNVTVWDYANHRDASLDPSVRLGGLWPFGPGKQIMPKIITRFSRRMGGRAVWLAHLIRMLKPDLIHSLEMQHAAYLTYDALASGICRRYPWIYSCWGADLSLFGRLKDHAPKIRKVLEACQFVFCECRRDSDLATAYGFRGRIMPLVQSTGGFNLPYIDTLRRAVPPSQRRTIVLKGYQGWAGRALVGLAALEQCRELLRDYRVAIISAGEDVKIAAALLADSGQVHIEILGQLPHEDILRLLDTARLTIGLSICDGVPNVMLEAMAMGAFPIQSNSGAEHEWIIDGQTGMLVPPNDPAAVANAIERGLTDDDLVDRAVATNYQVIAERLDSRQVQQTVVQLYEDIMQQVQTAQNELPTMIMTNEHERLAEIE